MAISGIVIKLSGERHVRARTLAALAGFDELELGVLDGGNLPAVLETASVREDRDCWERLLAMAGVVGIDLVAVHYDLEPEQAGGGADERVCSTRDRPAGRRTHG